jgi:hypothetical protein
MAAGGGWPTLDMNAIPGRRRVVGRAAALHRLRRCDRCVRAARPHVRWARAPNLACGGASRIRLWGRVLPPRLLRVSPAARLSAAGRSVAQRGMRGRDHRAGDEDEPLYVDGGDLRRLLRAEQRLDPTRPVRGLRPRDRLEKLVSRPASRDIRNSPPCPSAPPSLGARRGHLVRCQVGNSPRRIRTFTRSWEPRRGRRFGAWSAPSLQSATAAPPPDPRSGGPVWSWPTIIV